MAVLDNYGYEEAAPDFLAHTADDDPCVVNPQPWTTVATRAQQQQQQQHRRWSVDVLMGGPCQLIHSLLPVHGDERFHYGTTTASIDRTEKQPSDQRPTPMRLFNSLNDPDLVSSPHHVERMYHDYCMQAALLSSFEYSGTGNELKEKKNKHKKSTPMDDADSGSWDVVMSFLGRVLWGIVRFLMTVFTLIPLQIVSTAFVWTISMAIVSTGIWFLLYPHAITWNGWIITIDRESYN